MATEEITTMNIVKEVFIAAPMQIVFDIVLQPQAGLSEMNMKLEAWPGGRWFRDLGNNTGHLWGHVQVIKPPKVLEIVGPAMMSYPVASHIQYRLSEQSGGTLLKFAHRAIGLLDPEHVNGMTRGWGDIIEAVKTTAEKIAEYRA